MSRVIPAVVRQMPINVNIILISNRNINFKFIINNWAQWELDYLLVVWKGVSSTVHLPKCIFHACTLIICQLSEASEHVDVHFQIADHSNASTCYDYEHNFLSNVWKVWRQNAKRVQRITSKFLFIVPSSRGKNLLSNSRQQQVKDSLSVWGWHKSDLDWYAFSDAPNGAFSFSFCPLSINNMLSVSSSLSCTIRASIWRIRAQRKVHWDTFNFHL